MSIRLVLLILLGVAIALLVVSLLLQRRKKAKSRRSLYVDSLYALIEGKKQEALNLLTKAVKNGEEDIDAYLQLGHLLRENGQPAKALQIHRSLTVRRDLLVEEHKNIILAMAEDLKELGKMDKAIEELDNLGKKEKDSRVYRLLHELHHRLGNYHNAFDSLKNLSKTEKCITESHLSGYLAAVSEMMIEQDRMDEAGKWLKKAVKIDSESIPAIYISADLAMRYGNTKDAVEFWTSLMRVDMEDFNWILPKLEKSLYDSGKFHQLEQILEDILNKYPGNPSIIYALASFYEKKGEVERSIEILENNETKYEGKTYNRMKMALLYIKSGRYREAEEVLEREKELMYRDVIFNCLECGKELRYPAKFCNDCLSFDSYRKSDETILN